MTQEELKLIEDAVQGKENAFDKLYEYYYQTAYIIAMKYTRNDADAKDAVQEAFISIHKVINELRDPAAFPAWLKKIVHSKCYQIFRKKHDIPSDPDIIDQTYCVEERSYMIPFDHYNNENEKDVIHQLMQQLKPIYREVLELVYIQQMKIAEAAAILEIAPGTVKTRLHRAKKELSALVKQFEKENDRKIKFRSDMLMADSLIITLLFHVKKQMMTVKSYVVSNAFTSACMVTMSALLVSGAIFAYEDIQELKANDETAYQEEETDNHSNQTELSHAAFQATNYQDMHIDNSRSAYYICVNFIMKQTENKQIDKEAWEEIRPVYHALKQKNDAYYQRMVNEGYHLLFEQTYDF